MEQYNVYLHDVPKVSEDGKKSLPIKEHRTEEFSDLDAAGKHATEHKDAFDRVVVIRTAEDKQKMVMRYMDGEEIEVAAEEEPSATEEEPSAAEEEPSAAEEAEEADA